MKNIIDKSGLGLKGFAIRFGIPYNTVTQWYRGERNAPQWVKNLIEEQLTYKPLLDEYPRQIKKYAYVFTYDKIITKTTYSNEENIQRFYNELSIPKKNLFDHAESIYRYNLTNETKIK